MAGHVSDLFTIIIPEFFLPPSNNFDPLQHKAVIITTSSHT